MSDFLELLKNDFGDVTRFKRGSVHMNAEFTLHVEVAGGKYDFCNCEFHDGRIKYFTRTEITQADFEAE